METIIFEKKVERLANEPIDNSFNYQQLFNNTDYTNNTNNTNNTNISSNISIFYSFDQMHIDKFILNNNIENSTFYTNLVNERDEAIEKRQLKNDELFIKTIEYWIALAFLSFLIYLLIQYYNKLFKLKKKKWCYHRIFYY